MDRKCGWEGPAVCVAPESVGLGGITVDAQKSVCQGVRTLARSATTYNACSGAAQVFHQYYPQRDRHRPQLADGQWLNALIGADKTTERFGIETAISVGNKRPGHTEHARIALKRSIPQLGQQSIEARRKILADLADLLFDEVVVIE